MGVCLILLNYGGGFGVLPSLIKDFWNKTDADSLQSTTAWELVEFLGPQITAYMNHSLEMQDYMPIK